MFQLCLGVRDQLVRKREACESVGSEAYADCIEGFQVCMFTQSWRQI